MLGIVVALPWELKTLTRQTLQAGTCRPIRDNIIVALSGIGAERAYAVAALLLSQGATALLSWGCAAALDDRLSAGNVLLPHCVIGASGENHPVSIQWHRQLYQTLSAQYSVRTDALVESAALVKSPSEKQALAQRTMAIATDMESAAHARFARQHRLPFIVVRAVVDSVSTRLPENVMQSLDPEGEISVRSCLRHVFLQPADWMILVKLGIQFRAARKTLKETSAMVLDASQIYLNSISPDTAISSRG
jgi:adenosylhomocysteine nucleosidase